MAKPHTKGSPGQQGVQPTTDRLTSLTLPGGSQQGLSSQNLHQHNRTLVEGGGGSHAKLELIETWVRRQSTAPPGGDEGEEAPDTRTLDAKNEEFVPTLTLAGPGADDSPQILVTGGVSNLEARESTIRVARIKSMLRTDSKGNMLEELTMSKQGRYNSLGRDDPTFQKISFRDLAHVDDHSSGVKRGSSMDISACKGMGAAQDLGPRVSAASLARTVDPDGKLGSSKQQADSASDANTEESSGSRTTGSMKKTPPKPTLNRLTALFGRGATSTIPSDTDIISESGTGAASTIDFKDDASDATSRTAGTFRKGLKTPKMTIGAIAKLRKWKTKVDTQNVNTKKDFSIDADHLKFLQKHDDIVAVDLPIPIQMIIVEEALPIVQQTVKAYENSLGRNNPLTKEAERKLESLKYAEQIYNSYL